MVESVRRSVAVVWSLVVRRAGRNQQRSWLREILQPLT